MSATRTEHNKKYNNAAAHDTITLAHPSATVMSPVTLPMRYTIDIDKSHRDESLLARKPSPVSRRN